MINANDKAGDALPQTKTPLSSQSTHSLGTQLLEFDETLFKTLSGYYFLTASLYALTASDKDLHDERLLMGMTQVGDWLSGCSEQLLFEMSRIKGLVD